MVLLCFQHGQVVANNSPTGLLQTPPDMGTLKDPWDTKGLRERMKVPGLRIICDFVDAEICFYSVAVRSPFLYPRKPEPYRLATHEDYPLQPPQTRNAI